MGDRIELCIAERTEFAGGMAFGDSGAYLRIRGRARHAVDPADHPEITDIDKASVDGDGRVAFVADFTILAPRDPARGNRRLFHDWGNRGNCRALQFFNDAPHSNDPREAEHAGNGFLFRRGYTYVWSAWQADLLPGDGRAVLDAPVATDNGAPLTGPVRQEFIVNRPTPGFPLSSRASTRSHPAVSRDTRLARLTRRRYAWSERIEIPPDRWQFAQIQSGAGLAAEGAGGEIGVAPSDTHIYLPEGFQPGWIYELVYQGRDPLVGGVGHLAVRNLVGFLKYGERDDAGNPNPVGPIEKAYGWGRSQTGRCIRDFIHGGFNADAEGRRVFDGLLPHVAGAGRMWMNHRFANVVTAAGQQHEDHFNLADRFPFSYAESTDHLTGRTDAILKRPDSDPLVMHTQTSTEYWQRRGSLVHTDSRGRDLAQPDGVRVYLWSSSQHFANPRLGAPGRGDCQNLHNVVDTSMLFRALLDAMDRWATQGIAPPDSRIPRRDDGTLLTMAAWKARFPAIPGIALPRGPAGLPLLDFGPEADRGIVSREPPAVLDAEGYAVLVPAVDADGNESAGVRAPMVAAPMATYTGWNLRARGQGTGANHEFTGSTIPFPDSAEERAFTGDPRRSVQERYGDAEGYVAAITAAARQLVAEGLMLEEDVARCAAAARDWGRPRHSVTLD